MASMLESTKTSIAIGIAFCISSIRVCPCTDLTANVLRLVRFRGSFQIEPARRA